MEPLSLSPTVVTLSGVLIFIFGFIISYLFVSRVLKKQLNETQKHNISLEQNELVLLERLKLAEENIVNVSEQAEKYENRLQQALQIQNQLGADIADLKARLSAEKQSSSEKLQLLQQAKEQMNKEFRDLAAQVMEKNSDRFGKQQQENLSNILDPFKEQLGEFRKRVDHVYDIESRDRVSLLKEIEGLKMLNQQITEEASNLTQALKGDRKAQGNWGEVILERVLEASGLQKGREYETQMHLQSHDGNRYLPDVVIHLPENKDIIVDAKVSLSAYERYYAEEDDSLKKNHLKDHIQAIRQHVEKLSDKKYDDLKGINTLDFVIIFIPIEPAYLLAAQEDQNLFSESLARKIIIVSPTTLLATLRIVENVWRFERQNKNAEEIARQAGRLYDKFVGFVGDIDAVGLRLDQAYKSYEEAKNKLVQGKGNLVRSTERLKELGAKTRKQLDENLLENPTKNET
ncbi:MAG TPA: DNA recombination protein RmuC [Aeromonadales bacterium]|nr:DNA recombination protein RmuC [Aeromonadales bacterium]